MYAHRACMHRSCLGSVRIIASTHLVSLQTMDIKAQDMQVDEDATDKFMQMRRTDQQRALAMLRSDESLQSLQAIEAPLLDLEVAGVPALRYFGAQVWHEGVQAPHEGSEARADASNGAGAASE